MREMALSIGEPFTSPAWGSNFVVFSGENGNVISEDGAKEYFRKCCKYAMYYEVYLVPERFMLMGYECMCLVSPQGKMIGAQRAIHVNNSVKGGIKRGGSLEIYNTEFGGIFLCVDVDIYRPFVVRVASDMGSKYIICVQNMPRGDYSIDMVLTGVWSAAQSGSLFAISVSNQFHCICAPLALTKQNDGFIARPTLKTPLAKTMSADSLIEIARRRPLSRKLYATHRAELIG